MTPLDRKITRFVLELGLLMALCGALTVAFLWGLATLFPLPAESPARDLRNGAGMTLAIILATRISRWLERRGPR